MKTVIRQSVFETNSSSTHSLTMGKPAPFIPGNDIDLDSFTLTLGDGEYGWGPETLTSWEEKADYFIVDTDLNENRREMVIEAIKMKYPNVVLIIKETGYIDHQSQGEILEDLCTVQEIYDVIFGKSTIRIDHDNH